MMETKRKHFAGIPPFPVTNNEECFEGKKPKPPATEVNINVRFADVDEKSSDLPQTLACLAAAAFFFPTGFSLAFSAVLTPQLQQPFSDISVTDDDISWIANVFVLTLPVSSLLVGYFVDRLGRLTCLKLGALPYIVAWIVIATAQNVPMILAGRILAAVASCFQSNPALVYVSEIAKPNSRGTHSALCIASCSFGILFIYITGSLFYWRIMAWMLVPFALIPFIFSNLWAVESPAWLVSKGRTKEATTALCLLLRNDTKVGAVQRELTRLEENHRKSATKPRSSIIKLLKGCLKPTGYKPFLIVLMVFLLQQLSGITLVLFYAVNIFQAVGASVGPFLCTVGVGVISFFMFLLAAFMLKHFGRRPLFLISSLGMTVSVSAAGYLTRQIHIGEMEANILPAILILLYISFGVAGFITIPWTITSEMFPLEIRGKAQGLLMALATSLMFIVIKVFPYLQDMVGRIEYIFWTFGAVCLSSFFTILLFLPETHGKTLSQIEDYFKHNTIYLIRPKRRRKYEDESIPMN